MAVTDNLVLHICLPKGLALTSGATLMENTTLDVASTLTPFYAGIGQVKLNGGYFLRTTTDLTIACAIYNSSQEADLMTPNAIIPTLGTPAEVRWANSRTQWVTAKATRDLIMNIIGLIGSPGAHVLANFSVTRERGGMLESVAAKLADLNNDVKTYAVNLASNGQTLPGGHARPGFGAKGVRDWTERSPSRGWASTGIGANAKGPDYGSMTGGRGKPLSYFNRAWCSPPIINWRSGVYQGMYPLTTVFGEAGNSSGYGLRAGAGW
jgi:hypothetical protein